MIPSLSAYIKNIAVFLILMSLVSIIIPKKKYGYVNVIMAMILVFLVIQPLDVFFSELDMTDITNASIGFNGAVLKNEERFYEEAQRDAILAQYSYELSSHLKQLVEGAGVEYESSSFELDGGSENFGGILSLSVTVGLDAPQPEKKPFIRVEPVRIQAGGSSAAADKTAANVETSRINELKKLISDFYQILDEHIYIIVRERN